MTRLSCAGTAAQPLAWAGAEEGQTELQKFNLTHLAGGCWSSGTGSVSAVLYRDLLRLACNFSGDVALPDRDLGGPSLGLQGRGFNRFPVPQPMLVGMRVKKLPDPGLLCATIRLKESMGVTWPRGWW
jgi:hypothetical protein